MGTLSFHRPARRFPEAVAPGPVQLAAPPQVQAPNTTGGILQTVLPMLAMVGMMGFMFFIPSPFVVKALMGGAMGLTMVGTLVTKLMQGRAGKRKHSSDAAKYHAYLEQQAKHLDEKANAQLVGLERVHPPLDQLMDRAVHREHLWERRHSHDDFLHARVGTGATALAVPAQLEHNNNPLTEYEPELHESATLVVDRYSVLPDAPLSLDLEAVSSLAVIGQDSDTHSLMRALVCQLAVAHAPSDLTIAAYFPTANRNDWEWMKWLPHTRGQSTNKNGRGPECMLTDSPQVLAAVLARTVQSRRAIANRPPSSTEPEDDFPHLLLIIDGFAPRTAVSGIPDLTTLLEKGATMATTTIAVVRDRKDEPGHVSSRLEIGADSTFQLQSAAGGVSTAQTGVIERLDIDAAEAIARSLTPLRLREEREGASSASSGNLFTLLNVSGPDAVDPAVSWKVRPLSEVMRVPLGVRSDGEPLILDLKESAVGGMGPHGLVVGATGSGKSELLRTLVTGLAINHSPDILSYVFVDFKGGAAFADLAELPHVAGLITNLQGDLSRVDRMYSALVGEQERRQRLLRDAGNVDGIKEYQALYARRPQMEPMPYLMIVVDEFGELLVARPDFLDLFNAIGRVGRSLGMHLLLASQRLEEGRIRGLEGHLRYRICLRTFSAADSQTVIGTHDAYHLPSNPGAGYFKVDTTIYHRFQTAHVSAPYSGPSRVTRSRATHNVSIFTGLLEPESAGAIASAADQDAPTEMEVAIRRLRERARGLMRPVHQVWLPPLELSIPLAGVMRTAADQWNINLAAPRSFGFLRSAVGMLDQPAEQTQVPFLFDFSGTNGHLAVAGAPQTGKSTLLRTLITSYALTHSPHDVQFYCIDLGGGSLHPLESLPHVGAVCGKLDRDRIRRLIREMHSIVEERELSFRRNNIDSIATFRRRRLAGELPGETGTDVFLIIDNWGQVRADFEDIDAEIAPLLANGLGYGVHVIITTNRWGDLRTQLRDNIGFRLEFRLNDPAESELPRGAAKTLPIGIAGRGIEQHALQFQIALPDMDPQGDGSDPQAALEATIAAATQRWVGTREAKPVRLLPSIASMRELPDPKSKQNAGVPLGLDEFRLEPVWIDLFSADPHFMIFGDSESGKTNLIGLWMDQLRRRYSASEVQFLLVDYRRTLLDSGLGEYLYKYAATPNLANDAISEIRTILTARLPGSDVTREQLMSRSWWSGPEYVIFVDDYDLVVSPSGNPLAPLVDLLPQGRDVGMHLVTARRVGGMARSAFEAVLQRVKELGTPGIVMSGDPQEGPVLGTQKAAVLPPGRGYLVRRGQRTVIVQTALHNDSR